MLVQASGCTVARNVPQPWPAAVYPSSPKKKIEIVLLSGSEIRADSARVGNALLLGYRGQTVDTVPLSQVKKIQSQRQFSIVRTGWLLVGVLTIFVVAAMLICGDTCGEY